MNEEVLYFQLGVLLIILNYPFLLDSDYVCIFAGANELISARNKAIQTFAG